MKRGNLMNIVVYLGLFFTALVPSVSAEFNTSYEATKNIITVDDTAVFSISVQNYANENDSFKITVHDDFWSVSTSPIYVYQTQFGLEISKKSTDTFQLFLKPLSTLTPGIYTVPYFIESKNTKEIINRTLYVIIRPAGKFFGEYAPALRANLEINNNGLIDPRNPAVLSVKLENLNPLNYSELVIDLTSDLFSRQIKTSLYPLEQKTETIEIQLDPVQPPRRETVVATIRWGPEVLKTVKKSLEIISYSELILSESEKSGFLKKVEKRVYTNVGNVERKEKVFVEVSGFNKVFSKTNPEAKVEKKDNKIFLTWEMDLNPQERYEITIRYNYRLPFFLLLAVVIGVVLYFYFRSPVLIRKEGEIVQVTSGGITEVKILLYIRNRSKHQVSKIKVMDKIPNIADVKDEFIVGTMKPVKIVRHDKKGTLMEWEIPLLDAFEERIISYKIKSKLSIVGFFNLPPAIVKFRDEKQRERVAVSNKLKAVT